jgi:hypothetical protein
MTARESGSHEPAAYGDDLARPRLDRCAIIHTATTTDGEVGPLQAAAPGPLQVAVLNRYCRT